jgi:hypothetical protein
MLAKGSLFSWQDIIYHNVSAVPYGRLTGKGNIRSHHWPSVEGAESSHTPYDRQHLAQQQD